MKKTLSYFVYWLIQCTWGCIMTLIGAIAALGLIITGHKPKLLGPTVYFEVGHNWGGLELGGFFLCDKESPMSTKYHEAGHSLQNLVLGPLMPFLVCIPSATRYWLREFKTRIAMLSFSFILFISSLVLFTTFAWLFAVIGGLKFLVILMEVLRMYFVCVCLWLNLIEIPLYYDSKEKYQYIDYDAIWFEGQASRIGTKTYEKKEG